MKKNIFIIMSLLVIAGTISASEGSGSTKPKSPTTPTGQSSTLEECPWAPKKPLRKGAGARAED